MFSTAVCMFAVNDQVTNSNVYTEHLIQPQRELTNLSANNESIENDFYNVQQHTYEMVKVNIKENDYEKVDGRKSNVQETPPIPTPVRDKASKKEDDVYNAEEHISSVVNTKCNKRTNQETEEGDEGESKNY